MKPIGLKTCRGSAVGLGDTLTSLNGGCTGGKGQVIPARFTFQLWIKPGDQTSSDHSQVGVSNIGVHTNSRSSSSSRPVETITAVGVAKPMAQGQATSSTDSPYFKANLGLRLNATAATAAKTTLNMFCNGFGRPMWASPILHSQGLGLDHLAPFGKPSALVARAREKQNVCTGTASSRLRVTSYNVISQVCLT